VKWCRSLRAESIPATARHHLDDGVDFLGFNVRRYRGKLLIKPSKAAVKRIRERLSAEMKALRGHDAQMVLIRLNPSSGVLRGPRARCVMSPERGGWQGRAAGLHGCGARGW
jgi:hypothetical protein